MTKFSPVIEAFGAVLRGEGDQPARQPFSKQFATDDRADALSAEAPESVFNIVACPTRNCPKVGTPAQMQRHFRATGHGEPEEPQRVPNENVVGNPEGEWDEPMQKRRPKKRGTARLREIIRENERLQ